MTSEFSKAVEDDMLKEDCERLRQYSDKKWIEDLIYNELQEFIKDNEHSYEEVFVLYLYYGRILERLKGE